jgi:predicted transcriptional regulator
VTPQDEAALADAYADVAAGRLVAHEEALSRLLGKT